MHVVAVVAIDGVVPFDLATPCDLFGHVVLRSGRPAYEVRVCAMGSEVDAGAFRLRSPWRLSALRDAQTIIVPGVVDVARAIPKALLDALRAAARRRARLASICSGAFVLAAAGLLDGRRATTHWRVADELSRRYPRVTVDPNVLFVDEGRILTSAGLAAGLDLCLHMIRRDHGADVAAEAARNAVMPLEREGGQAQFIERPPPLAEGASLEPVMRWIEANAASALTLGRIARRAATSTRTLSRRFREQTGTTPLQWLHAVRVREGRRLLETTDAPIEHVAAAVGFGSATTFRTCFQRLVGTSPRAYRSAFRRRPAA